MQRVTIRDIGAAQAWRDAARGFLSTATPPDQIIWGDVRSEPDLFARSTKSAQQANHTVPRSFISLANTVVWHSDPERFARLYAFLWRVKDAPHLMSDRGDRDLSRLRQMEKNVRRCQHKMKAFVRFREISAPDATRRSFAAWFEPTHNTVEPTADFFARRFADMDWRILTPKVSAIFEDGKLTFQAGQSKPQLPEDASEELWITYFRNIFNPARLKVQAMQSEMPKKYWKTCRRRQQSPTLSPTPLSAPAKWLPPPLPCRQNVCSRCRRNWQAVCRPGMGQTISSPAQSRPAHAVRYIAAPRRRCRVKGHLMPI